MILKQLRLEKGYTKAEVAKAIGVSVSEYRKYERSFKALGKAPITVVYGLSELYDVSADYMLADYIASGQWKQGYKT